MDHFESFPEDITKWEVLRDMVDLDLNDEFNDDSLKSGPRVQLLPRKTVNLYGNIPKMEQRIFSKCRECRLIFNPRNILSHKACMGRSHSSSSSSFDLKKKLKNKSSKKSHSNSPSPPPFKKPSSPSSPSTLSAVADLSKVISPKASKHSSSPVASSPTNSSASPSHKSSSKISSNSFSSKTNSSLILKSSKCEHSPHSSRLTKLFSNSTDSSADSTSASKSSSSSSSSSSSRHKKSRKSSSSNSKSVEEFNPSIHCGVIEDNKGPCTRSLSCSNHRSQLRKLVSSRSKEVHHLLSERKISKEKSTKHNSSKTHNFPNDLETKDTGESYVPTSVNSNTLSIILPKTTDPLTQNSATSNKQLLDITDFDIKFSKTAEVLLNNESDAGTVPVVYMPMSPVSVVNPVEYVKIGKNIIRLETPQTAISPPITTNQSVFVGIPNNINVKMYNSHPKPITLPSFGAKKIGGAMLLSKHQLELQRNNLLLAISCNINIGSSIDSHRSSLNNSNVLYKSNILKNKNTNKSNSCKRSMSEKSNNSDNKQMKYSSNLNGFLIHSTISETADAPSSNMLMNDKMTFLNMK